MMIGFGDEPEADLPPLPAGPVHYFGDYELFEEIARGGMGIVYRARQVDLNRFVAVKLILGGRFAGEMELQRFRAETEAVARLDHPHIVPIYEVGQHGGQQYFSMKLVVGGNLSGQMERFRSDNRSAAQLLAQVARAIHHAHQHGILHRDLKPANILVDVQGQPHITDFGLAKNLEKASNLTLSGMVMGTPSFMAPEQATGRAKEVTASTDIHALGAILYQMLTGVPPFQAETPLETLRQVAEETPRPPTSLNPGTDRDLATVCLKCLAKDPARRYQSAEALAEDLERWLRREPVHARRTLPHERLLKLLARSPAIAGMAMVTLLATGIALYGALRWRLPAGPAGGVVISVSTTADGGRGSLREVIARVQPGATIRFDLALAGRTIVVTNGALVLDKDLTLIGPGPDRLTISGHRINRVFHVGSNSTVLLSGVSITEGASRGEEVSERGGGIRIEPGSTLALKRIVLKGNRAGMGGAIMNHGSLAIEDSTLRDNTSVGGGAGIYNEGFLRLNRVTFSSNVNTSGFGGGAVENLNGTVHAHNCTFVGHESVFGAIWNFSHSATLNLDSCTLSGNLVGLGNADTENEGMLMVRNTIVAGNRTDLFNSGRIRSGGHNLIGVGNDGVFAPAETDLVGTDVQPIDPLLGPLADNDSATCTMMPLAGSPAIGAGHYTGQAGNPLALDQRGKPRPGIGPCDIGAVQASGSR